MEEIIKQYMEAIIDKDITLLDNKITSSKNFCITNTELIIKPELYNKLKQFFGQDIELNIIGEAIIKIIKDRILKASTIPIDWMDLSSKDDYNPFDVFSHLEYSILNDRPDITFRGKPSSFNFESRLKEFKRRVESIPKLTNLTYIVPEKNDWMRLFC
jgi:hypothetical protein